MNYGIVAKIIGNLLLFEAVALLPSIGISIYDDGYDSVAFFETIFLTFTIGYFMSKIPIQKRKVRIKEAITIVTLGWIVVSVFGALPFYFSGVLPNFADAFFETVSGLTTTGSTVINDVEILPMGILFWRSFLHWLGGMGILVLALAIMPTIGVGAHQIFKAETTGPISDKVAPKLKDTAKILYIAYLGITVLQTVLLMFGGMDLFQALIHTFGTVGTGGFSTKNTSVGAFHSSYITLVIGIFMMLSGINFSLYYELYKKRFRHILQNIELRAYLSIILVSTILIAINIYSLYGSVFESFKHAFFQVSSIITTTGYSSVNYDLWPSFSKAILFFLMFVGGSAGSTGGAIKVIRIVILFMFVRREIKKLLHPRALIPIQLNNKTLSGDVVAGVTGFFFLYMLLFAAGTILLSLEGIDFSTAASASASSIGNVGPGFELVGPYKTYSFFSAPSKYLMSLLMLFGRLELFTIFILFTPSHWTKD